MAESKLTDLIAKLEAATGPDREADCEIWAIARGLDLEWQGTTLVAGDEGVIGWIDPGQHSRNFHTNRSATAPGSIPTYTASLDAIVALIERKLPGKVGDLVHDARAAVSRDHALHIRFWKPDTDGSYTTALALALCIALLSALQLQGGSEQ